MSVSKIVCLNLVLLLTFTHGLGVVARIRFQSLHYIVSENSPFICVTVENIDPPSSESFSVSFSFDSVLIGSRDSTLLSPRRTGSLIFRSGNIVSDLCFPHIDDDIACEPDITGQIRLINSSAVGIVQPSTATVTIRDDDSASIGFLRSEYTYSEDEVLGDEQFPIIESSNPSLLITLRIREGQHSDVFVSRSLTVPDSLLTVNSTREYFQLSVHDDDVALEAQEVLILELSIDTQLMLCSTLELSPFRQTQITILDNDDVTIGLRESDVVISESGRTVSLCVSISKRVARALAFRLTTRNGTAESGEDFTARNITGQFLPLSDQTELCYEIAIILDSVIEQTEAFSVALTMETSLPDEVTQRLSFTNTLTTVQIRDSSDCFRVILDKEVESQSPQLVPVSSTVCFDCAATGRTLSAAVVWTLDGTQYMNGDRFTNGHVLNNGTLLITNSGETFDFSQQTSISCSSDGLAETTLNILLGAPPLVLTLMITSPMSEDNSQMLSCLFEGVPRPQVEWLFNDHPVSEDHSSVESTVPEYETRYRSVLTLPKDGVLETGVYTCMCSNQFGNSQRTITVREKAESAGVTSRSDALAVSTGLLLLSILCVVLFL